MRSWPVAAAFCCLLAACEGGPRVVTPPSPSTQGTVHPDLPLPEGFVYRKNVSDKNPTGAFRVVNQTAVGKNRNVEFAAKFYREVFPRHGWTLEGEDRSPRGNVSLVFVKKEERCRIQLRASDRTTTTAVIDVNRKE